MLEIQAITFDAGGTLITPWPSVGHVYATVAAEHGITGIAPEELNKRFLSAWEALDCRAETRQDWTSIVHATFEGVRSIRDPNGLFEALYSRFMEPRSWRVFKDVPSTLEELRRRGVRVGVISNWDDRLRPLLARLGLAEFFEVMVISCEVGCRKPDPEIFGRAAQAFGLRPEQILHVGDSREHDLDGANRAGMQAVGIRRDSTPADPAWIPRLDELLGRL